VGKRLEGDLTRSEKIGELHEGASVRGRGSVCAKTDRKKEPGPSHAQIIPTRNFHIAPFLPILPSEWSLSVQMRRVCAYGRLFRKRQETTFIHIRCQPLPWCPKRKCCGCSSSARISSDSTNRGPGRLKNWLPSVTNTWPLRTARNSSHPGRL